MSKVNNHILHSSGYCYLGDDDLFDVTDLQVTLGLNIIEAQLKNSVDAIPTGQPLSGRIQVAGMNIPLLSRLTGGTVSTGSRKLQKETLTKVSNALTLSQTPNDTDRIRITPVAADIPPLIQVASSPNTGEYSISGTTVTLNASQSESDFLCEYFYADASNGQTLALDPSDLPSSFKFMGAVPAKDVFSGVEGWLAIEAAKVQRTSEIVLGASKGNHTPLEFNINILNTTPGDFNIYLV